MESIIRKYMEEINMNLPDDKIKALSEYYYEVINWNEKINLTSITDKIDFAIKHIIDSIFLLKLLDIPVKSRIIDVGTGAGIPGIILKIARSDLNVTLLDSIKKKTDFVKEIIEKLNLKDALVLNKRAEEAGKDKNHREAYNYSIARAVSGLPTLAELCLPFVKINGYFIAMKGENVEEEVKDSEKAISLLGGSIIDIFSYELPMGYKRRIIIVEKIKPTPEQYPRRAGIPEKRPLK
ncbi:MAG: 16S rRNA (guanine(527)-N(7))-methyltransferase RsmG [Thermovenabulum sp.]|uniref:16S rRNA (guanine(527)-N(7))-methyltransferase RsmG n=1 Tax=Thermovenabulum sp. TaxID=3100335 RepID=UPI003C79F1F7